MIPHTIRPLVRNVLDVEDLRKVEEDREEERYWWALEEWPEELRPAPLPEKD